MAKCPIETGRPAPGMHGQRRGRKLSDYGVQLREKQRLRRMFGLQERPFRYMFRRALKARGVTGERLLQMLEMRLDNVVYRLGFAPSRAAARQFVRHGHVQVNGRKASVPSLTLKGGDVVEVRNRERSRRYAGQHVEAAESRGIVPWLQLEKEQFRGQVLRVPTREEITCPVNEQLIVELYSK